MGDNCVCNLIKGIWSFIIGSLRMILFLGCLLFVLIQLLWIFSLVIFDMRYGGAMPDLEIGFHIYFHAISVFAVAVIGCYGSFYKHHSSIRAFSLLTAINTAILIIILLYSKNPEEMSKFNAKFSEKLQHYEKLYDWIGDNSKYGDKQVATEVWDLLQMSGCCGLKGPQDWNEYRPGNVLSNEYPRSCCPLGDFPSQGKYPEFCTAKRGLYETGCMEHIEKFEITEIKIYVMFIGVQLILCALSCIVGTLNLENCNRRPSSNSYIHAPVQDSNYQRFSGSVYVRQPYANESFRHQDKNAPPPLYPNARAVEDPAYNAPPPSYGTVL